MSIQTFWQKLSCILYKKLCCIYIVPTVKKKKKLYIGNQILRSVTNLKSMSSSPALLTNLTAVLACIFSALFIPSFFPIFTLTDAFILFWVFFCFSSSLQWQRWGEGGGRKRRVLMHKAVLVKNWTYPGNSPNLIPKTCLWFDAKAEYSIVLSVCRTACLLWKRSSKQKDKKQLDTPPSLQTHTSFQKIPYSLAFRVVRNKSSRKKKGLSHKHDEKTLFKFTADMIKAKKSKILLLLLDLPHSTFGFGPFCSENCWWRRDIRVWPENTMMTCVLEKCKALTQLPKLFWARL